MSVVIKPVAEAVSAHLAVTSTGRTAVADDPDEVAALLKSLGLAYHITTDDRATVAVVAQRPELVDAYQHTHDGATVGRLLGYPETATAAYVHGRCLTISKQEAVHRAVGLPADFMPFRFSRDHWQDELSVAEEWFETLRACGLAPGPAETSGTPALRAA